MPSPKVHLYRLACILSALLVSSLAQQGWAQLAAPQVNPGAITPKPATELLPPSERPAQQQQLIPPPSQAQTKIDIPEPPTVVELHVNRFMVKHLSVTGNILVDDQTLRSILQPYEGKELSLDELGKVVEKINEQYRKQGYLTSLAYIPPQDITGGDIVIKVLEGRVGDVSVFGNRFYRSSVIARNLDMGTGDPLNIPKLEENLKLVNRLEDYKVRATLNPGREAGVTNMRLDVQERQPWQLGLTYDNQGRPFIGTMRWGTELTNRNVTGIGDRFTTRWIGASGTQIASSSYTIPVSRYGTELSGIFSFSHVNVDLPHNNNSITGNAYNYSIIASQPLDRKRTFTLDAGMNFRRINSYQDHHLTNGDNINSLQFGLNFDKFDRLGRTFARVQTSVAPSWGRSDQFWKMETLFNRVITLPHNNYLLFRQYSQFTPDALPPAEQFQLGGAYSVRGYSEGFLFGDRGYQFETEYRWPIPGLRQISPWVADRVQGAVFFDFGQTWLDRSNRSFIGGLSNRAGHTTLAGTGIGLRIRLTQYVQGFVDFGFGLLDRGHIIPDVAEPHMRVHFGLRSDLLPETYKTWGKKETKVKVKARDRKYVKARAKIDHTADQKELNK